MKNFIKRILSFVFVLSLLFIFTACKSDNISQKKLTNYQIYLEYNGENTVTATQTVEFTNNTTDILNSIVFITYPNGFSKTTPIKPIELSDYNLAYYSGESFGNITIKSVYVNGEKTNFKNENLLLTVQTLTPLKVNKTVIISLEYEVILANVNHRLGRTKNGVNLTDFFPIIPAYNNGFYLTEYYPLGDPYYLDNSNFYVELTLPSTYVVASSMSPKNVIVNNEKTTYAYSRKNAKTIAFSASKNYNVITQNAGDIKVFYYYYLDNSPEQTLSTAVKCINYFSKIFAPYPYPEYVVAECDFSYGGMEYPSFSVVSSSSEKVYVTAHETAHQWWYGIVGVNQIEEGFLDEGLTEFSTCLFLSEHKEYGVSYNYLKSQTKSNLDNAIYQIKLSNLNYNLKLKRHLKDYTLAQEYVASAYYKSNLMFFDIADSMGKQEFVNFLKEYLNANYFKNVSSNGFYKSLLKYSESGGEIYKFYLNAQK